MTSKRSKLCNETTRLRLLVPLKFWISWRYFQCIVCKSIDPWGIVVYLLNYSNKKSYILHTCMHVDILMAKFVVMTLLACEQALLFGWASGDAARSPAFASPLACLSRVYFSQYLPNGELARRLWHFKRTTLGWADQSSGEFSKESCCIICKILPLKLSLKNTSEQNFVLKLINFYNIPKIVQ